MNGKRKLILLSTESLALAALILLGSCNSGKEPETKAPADKRIKKFSDEEVLRMGKPVETAVTPQLADGLTLKLWGIDSLVADPVTIDIDDYGKLYYTRTNRQKNSEFDIRSHQDWEIKSIALKNIEEKRAFLHSELSPENSEKNKWLRDVNKDGSHDWRDMAVEKEHVYRLEDTSGDGLADLSQLVIEDFNDEVADAAGGVLKHNDDLFVAIGPDLWKINDNDNDGLADVKKSLSHGYGVRVGFSGHGMSGIEIGPDGRIYWQIGDIGFSGTGQNGEKYDYPNSGVIVRSNPDGSDFEVFAHGNRNTHEFAFDEYGNLISEDNDGDHAGERERIVYVVNGADIGWRSNWQFGKYRDPENNTYKVWMDERLHVPHFDGQAAYITPTIANFVNGPTGFLYNPGTALSDEWKNTFFVVEFVGGPAQSGIHSFKLKPKGATFELGETKKVLGGVLATGIDFGPDGAMYVADWIEGWETKDHGRIWKLDVATPDQKVRSEVKALLADDFKKYEDNKLGELLRHADMRVRQKAQFELANRGEKGLAVFTQSITQRDHQLARVHAIWGISQLGRKDAKNAQALLPLLKDEDPEIRAQAAKWLGDIKYKDAGAELIPLLKDQYSRARFFAAEALGRIEYKPAVENIIELLAANNDQDTYIRHAGSLALARIGDGDKVAALASHPSRAVRLAAAVALRRMNNKDIGQFVNDKDELVATEAARGINDDLSITEALPALANVLVTTKFKNEAFIRRSINANLRVGTDQNVENLLAYAAKDTNPAAMRSEALAALSTWAKPSVLDRVDGRFRGEITRDAANVRKAAGPILLTLSATREPSVRMAAIRAIGKLGITEGGERVFLSLKSDANAEVRAEALKTLSVLKDKQVGEAIRLALQDKQKDVRVVALDLLPAVNLPPAQSVPLLYDVITTKTIEEKQAALVTLGDIPLKDTKPTFEKLLGLLETKKLPAEVTLELEDALVKAGAADLKQRMKTIMQKTTTDTLKAAYAGALYGGNVEKGGRIFYAHQAAQCIRCHSYGDYGGNAGPRLNGVASRLTREQLLEAVINPSARIAPGYGMATIELTNGKKISGIVQEDKTSSIRMKVGSKPDTVIQQQSIAKKTFSPSSMPPMPALLTKKEIRDVVSFLAVLKE
jgi:quinoprotein glucose dehydrogenase